MSKTKELAKESANRLIHMFSTGDIAKPLSYAFLNMSEDVPMFKNWGINNILNCVAIGMTDARTFKQWLDAGRCVRKGEHAQTVIWAPVKRPKDKNDPESPLVMVSIRPYAVFDVSQTDGDPLPETHCRQVMADRPLIEVANHWGITVHPLIGDRAAGTYSRNRNEIRLLVSNTQTWLHELIHAADDRAGNIEEFTNNWQNETVAELGAATLAAMIGEEVDSGGAWQYISEYADENDIKPLDACHQVLDRISTAVSLILDTAKEIGLLEDFFAEVEAKEACHV